jgi:hypothetical protein
VGLGCIFREVQDLRLSLDSEYDYLFAVIDSRIVVTALAELYHRPLENFRFLREPLSSFQKILLGNNLKGCSKLLCF